MVSEKEKQVTYNVLKVLRERPCLWQKTHKHYLNKQIRLECYEELLEIYKQFDEEATLLTLKRKLMNMRTNYVKELSKVLSSKKRAGEEPYVPTLWYYEGLNFLSFLGKKCRSRTTSYTENEANESPDEDSGAQESCHSIFLQSYDTLEDSATTVVTTSTTDSAITATSSRTGVDRSTVRVIKRPRDELDDSDVKSYHEEISSAEEAAFDTFGRSVAMQLKTMSVENALLAQSRIQSILTEIGITDHRQKIAEKLKKL